ncbi:MAG: MCE family protein [Ignavibacteria bacterium]|nr:MCE family protein [Ignavibacteria bacterium]
MEKRSSAIRLGIFIVIGVAAVVVAIFLVGKEEGLFRESFRVSSYFGTIEGLRTGASVRLAGVDIGVVDRIEISPEENKVRVGLKLNAEVKKFIKRDSYASIEQEGLVGNKYVALSVGSEASEEVGDGDVVLSREPFRLAVVMEEAQGVIASTRRATEELARILASVNRGQGTMGKLITDDEVYRSLQRATAQADTSLRKTAEEFANIPRFLSGVSENLADVIKDLGRLIADADTVVINAKDVITKVNRGQGTLGALIVERRIYDDLSVVVGKMIEMAEEARSGAERFDENMEALRHNWFFKGYFEDRGYWDKAEFEKELDTKIANLRKLEEDLKRQSDELERRAEQLLKREEAVRQKEKKQE